jgi:hypothetical protein
MEPDDLLYTDLDGVRCQLQDVIYDGLDRDYAARYPALIRLLGEGAPAGRLYACVMLASWGVAEGFATLIAWAREPAAVPWAGAPVTFDRHYGADDAFAMLADAVRVAGEVADDGAIAARRVAAGRALLGIYDRVYFGRALLVALDLDPALAATLAPEIAQAVDRAVAAAGTGAPPFDLATQAAFLLGPLAALDDAHAARAAGALLAAHGDPSRPAREVAYALRAGSGPATRAILARLAVGPGESVRTDARDSLARRKDA